MAGIFFSDWARYAAMGVLALGLGLAARGIWRCCAALPHPLSGDMEPLAWMSGFRLSILGLAAVGAGAAWLWHLNWLLALCLVVGFEEMLETSFAIAAMRAERRPQPSGGAARPGRITRAAAR